MKVISIESNLNSLLNEIKPNDQQKKNLSLERHELVEFTKITELDDTETLNRIAAWEYCQEEHLSGVILDCRETKNVLKDQQELKKEKERLERMRNVQLKDTIVFEVKAYDGHALNSVY